MPKPLVEARIDLQSKLQLQLTAALQHAPSIDGDGGEARTAVAVSETDGVSARRRLGLGTCLETNRDGTIASHVCRMLTVAEGITKWNPRDCAMPILA